MKPVGKDEGALAGLAFSILSRIDADETERLGMDEEELDRTFSILSRIDADETYQHFGAGG